MHPISKLNFGEGTGKIAVKFSSLADGADGDLDPDIVTGYIVKQVGTNRFIVSTTDESLTRTLTLAQTSAELTTMATSTSSTVNVFCTIEITKFGGGVENVKRITAGRVETVQGSSLTWKLGVAAAATGQGTIAVQA